MIEHYVPIAEAAKFLDQKRTIRPKVKIIDKLKSLFHDTPDQSAFRRIFDAAIEDRLRLCAYFDGLLMTCYDNPIEVLTDPENPLFLYGQATGYISIAARVGTLESGFCDMQRVTFTELISWNDANGRSLSVLDDHYHYDANGRSLSDDHVLTDLDDRDDYNTNAGVFSDASTLSALDDHDDYFAGCVRHVPAPEKYLPHGVKPVFEGIRIPISELLIPESDLLRLSRTPPMTQIPAKPLPPEFFENADSKENAPPPQTDKVDQRLVKLVEVIESMEIDPMSFSSREHKRKIWEECKRQDFKLFPLAYNSFGKGDRSVWMTAKNKGLIKPT